MRKVLFKKYISIQRDACGNKIEGTGMFEVEFENSGTFHQFGLSMEEDERGFTNYSIAIIEDKNGNIHEILPQNMKFVQEVSEGKKYRFKGIKDGEYHFEKDINEKAK